jgi:NAD(P)-dependent dehydrogenase (short-subunit alcohol dehydrogenase family)
MTPIDKFSHEQKEYFRKKWSIPLGRAGVPKDYAQAVFSLAVNQYCSGSTLIVDGGYLLDRP